MSAIKSETRKKSWVEEKAYAELARVRKAKEDQGYPYFREFDAAGLHASIAGKPVINFSSNDYLGLTNHPKVKEAAKRAVDKYACGLSSSRVQATTTEHVELERRLAKWFGFEQCLMFTTGYQAMLGTHRVARRQGHDAHPRRLQPRLHPRRHVPRRRHPGAAARGALLQPQLGQEPRADPEDARAQERARGRRGGLLARRRHGATSPSSSSSATATTPSSSSTTRTARGTLGQERTRHPRGRASRARADRRLDLLEDVRRHRRHPPRQGATSSTGEAQRREASSSARRSRSRSSRPRRTILDMLESDGRRW